MCMEFSDTATILCFFAESVALYPYGGEDDAKLGDSDEGMSGIQYLPKEIPFYGKSYNKIVVS